MSAIRGLFKATLPTMEEPATASDDARPEAVPPNDNPGCVRVLFTNTQPRRRRNGPFLWVVIGVLTGLAGASLLTRTPVPPARSPLPASPPAPMSPPPPTPRDATPTAPKAHRLAERRQFLAIPDGASFRVERHPTLDEAAPILALGYAALLRGDMQGADDAYQEVLSSQPDHRQALLSLAALAQRRGDDGRARGYYQRLLERDPEDPLAVAGLLQFEPINDAERVSRLKALILRQPQLPTLQALLGETHAAGGRWAEAHICYLRALALDRASDPGEVANPDYAFDLAVALEHLGRAEDAQAFYRVALDALRRRPGNFDPNAAEARLRILAEI